MVSKAQRLKAIIPGRLEAIAFITGFALMAFELAAARILAPSIGSSTYVWTSVIGVIIAALSVGYWLGGYIADRRARAIDISWLLLGSALLVAVTFVLYSAFLPWVAQTIIDSRLQAVVASVVLFAPVSCLLGAISSYLVKIKVTSLQTTGQSVASLSAHNSVGGIVGTFVTGFILFNYIGSRETLLVVMTLLLACSWLLLPVYRWQLRVVTTILLLVTTLISMPQTATLASLDTPTAHYEVVKGSYNNQQVHALITGPRNAQSAVYTDSSELVFWYNKKIAEVALQLQPKNILILGGGAFTLPQYLAQKMPQATIDAVEIDEGLEAIANQYFNYKNPSNVQIHFQDARIFLEQNQKKYDLIISDVYGDKSVPFSLMTQEYAEQVAKATAQNGVVALNVMAGLNGSCRDILSAIDTLYRPSFPQALWKTSVGDVAYQANFVMLYSRHAVQADAMEPFPAQKKLVFTDNFAPSDRLYFNCDKEAVTQQNIRR